MRRRGGGEEGRRRGARTNNRMRTITSVKNTCYHCRVPNVHVSIGRRNTHTCGHTNIVFGLSFTTKVLL